MPSSLQLPALLSSLTIRIGAYVFLRWIPGHHFIPIMFTSFAIYVFSFFIDLISTPSFKVVADEIDIFTRPIGVLHTPASDPAGSTTKDEIIEEIDFQETVVFEEKPAGALSTLLTGLPSPSSWPWSALTFLINLALVAMVADLTFRPALFWPSHDLSFARLGYVSETSARIFVREPDISNLPLYLSYRYADPPEGRRMFDNAWKHAETVKWLSDETDYTTGLLIDDLQPDTRYQYVLSNNHSGHFITAPRTGQISQRSEFGDKFTFLHSSCILPRFPYNPGQHPLEIPGFKSLSKWLGRLKPAFMLFLGDFIYIDVPRRHGIDRETYRREYRQIYASPDWPLVTSTKHSSSTEDNYDIPWLHTYDDHEIANDWAGNTTTLFPAAFDPYLYYHLSVNPPLFLSTSVTQEDLVVDGTLPTWSVFDNGPASFFILDTRRYRIRSNPADPSDPTVSMLGTLQLVSLLAWLARPAPAGISWKFVVSSVPFTKNWRGPSTEDTWAGYLHERHIILEAMWKYSAENSLGVVVLSGDRHEFAATAFPPSEGSRWPTSATVHEFSCSPLSMFYLPVRTYSQQDAEDVTIKYIPDGNSKFGAVEITNPTLSGQSILTYRLFVDGKEAWSHLLTAGGRIDGTRTFDRTRSQTSAKSVRGGLIGLVKEAWQRIAGGANAVVEEVRDVAEEGMEAVNTAGERVESVADELEERARRLVDGVEHSVQDLAEDVQGYVGEAAEEVGEAAEGGRKEFWVGRSDRWTERWGLDGAE